MRRSLLASLEQVRWQLQRCGDRIVIQWRIEPCCSVERIESAERALAVRLPDACKWVLTREASAVTFAWNGRLSPKGKEWHGGVHLLSIDDVVDEAQALRRAVADLKADDASESAEAMRHDYPHWVPFVAFRNGDHFCLDGQSSSLNDSAVVFQEHDVNDGGPYIHGLRIADGFADLIERWSCVGFVEPQDWSAECNETGLDPDSEGISELRKRLK